MIFGLIVLLMGLVFWTMGANSVAIVMFVGCGAALSTLMSAVQLNKEVAALTRNVERTAKAVAGPPPIVPYDEGLAAIGVIQPEFIEEVVGWTHAEPLYQRTRRALVPRDAQDVIEEFGVGPIAYVDKHGELVAFDEPKWLAPEPITEQKLVWRRVS